MKKYLYITILVFLILGILAQVMPASAGAVKTPVNGLLTYLGPSDEQPDKRIWWAGHNGSVLQWRNGVSFFKWESTDTRLCGYSIYEFNANAHWTTEGVMNASNQIGKETVYTNDDFKDPIWSCLVVYTNNAIMKENCQGVGIYKGLEARLVLDLSNSFEGYILDPGGE